MKRRTLFSMLLAPAVVLLGMKRQDQIETDAVLSVAEPAETIPDDDWAEYDIQTMPTSGLVWR